MHTDPDQIPEEEQAVPPGDDSNDDPAPSLPADPGTPARNPAVDSDWAANDPAYAPSGKPNREQT